MQKTEKILPLFLNTDVDYESMPTTDSPFIKGLSWDIGANPEQNIGTSNPTGEGQNMISLKKSRSNIVVPNVMLPEGYNKNIGSFESQTTQDTFICNFNDKGNHGIYILSGNDGIFRTVVIDPELGFSDDSEYFISNHRCTLRFTLRKDGSVLEKYFLITDGKGWQKFINVNAAIKTNGFDASIYPYWRLLPPHFDRRELLEWPVRKPMYKPEITPLANSVQDNNKVNYLVDTAFQFTYLFQNTDGRTSDPAPYSLPFYVKSEDFLFNPDLLTKSITLKLYAGSPLTEKIIIYVRQNKKNSDGSVNTLEWGDWFEYDTIDKFSTCGENDPEIIGENYWMRTGAWSEYEYDNIFNTIKYTFDNSKRGQIVDQETALMLQTSMPLRSVGLSDLNDATILGNNQYYYDNLPCEVTGKMDVVVKEKPSTYCPVPLRKIRLYAYTGYPADTAAFISQVGYYNGSDTQMRFGGVYIDQGADPVTINIDESKSFSLDFGGNDAFVCYLKGTPYYSVGKWYVVNTDNTLTKIDNLLDGSLESTKTYIHSILANNSYFVCVFDLEVPAGRYNATLGRHNVSLSGDFRGQSTYIMGIANSRNKSAFSADTTVIKTNALVTQSKEMEIDCTAGDIDVWGNGKDLFYIYCPYATQKGNRRFRFIEGYLREARNNPVPIELFPYAMTHNAMDDGGRITDKNGFFFAYTKVNNSNVVDIEFTCKLNCAYPTVFSQPTNQTGSGWRPNNNVYLTDYNNNVVGDCNRIIYQGKITDLTGTVGYANVGVSMVDGPTVYTKQDGTFEMIVHNGQNTQRISNVYVNAGGNYLITLSNCGNIPLYNFDENNVSCIPCQKRTYPFQLNLPVVIQTGGQTSLKENGSYEVGFALADRAGRLTFVNVIKDIKVSSFLDRNDILATFFQLKINGSLSLKKYMPEVAWFSPYVSKIQNIVKYVDWVGDNIKYIDNNGNVVVDSASAVFCSINITSLYDYNISRNFSTLSTYQFVDGDRVRVLDDGDGNLLNTSFYGSPIDLRVLGTDYNQAAINAGLIPNTSTVPVINNNVTTTAEQTEQNTSVTILVPYDSRLDKLIDKTGFWIEIYTPSQVNEIVKFFETAGFWPVINGEVANFSGYSNGAPVYSYPTTIDIEFWDTYFLQRSITIKNVGNKFFGHPFESPNISDSFGANITGGGRVGNVKNPDAVQKWFPGDTIKSGSFIKEGLINGLADFDSTDRKDFSSYPWGAIIGIITQRSTILFICENDFFVTDYNFHYSYANDQGIMVTNLNEGLSTPMKKIGNQYGCSSVDTQTIIDFDNYVWWFDRKNEAWVQCNYRGAVDVTRIDKESGTQGAIQSYFQTKTNFITDWNNNNDRKDWFDVSAGIDMELGNIYVTFRPRRNKSKNLNSFINTRRNIDLSHQETLVFNISSGRWSRFENFTPESYARCKGNATGVEMMTFANGVPYFHNQSPNVSALNYYGVQTEPVIIAVFNGDKGINKIFQSLMLNSNPYGWYCDLMYTNNKNSFSYLSLNQFKKKQNLFYAAILRDMYSYPPISENELFRSMLVDGKRVYSLYLIFRLVGDPNFKSGYTELKSISLLQTQAGGNKP